MAAAIALRDDYESTQLREAVEDADQVRRRLALALFYDGGSRSAGALAGGARRRCRCDQHRHRQSGQGICVLFARHRRPRSLSPR
jgi:hypothetical protein